jgi:hypothetical protein
MMGNNRREDTMHYLHRLMNYYLLYFDNRSKETNVFKLEKDKSKPEEKQLELNVQLIR